ncbi:MAG: hypothetical protein JXR94_01235 [Candidatus Hydrogenedentes bacterium]|nr:hypothetical protein [Candidatus Hydrogenedentota bacterium]
MSYRNTYAVVALLCLSMLAACTTPGPAPPPAGPPVEARLPDVRLAMPPTIYATPGVETNLYFDNVVLALYPANYAFDIASPRGVQQAERWTYTPDAEDTRSFHITLRVFDQANRLLAEGTSAVVVTPADAGVGESVSALLIGDSLTAASVYSQHLLDLCAAPGNPALALVGSRAPKSDAPANRHEGYGGWTAERFATHFTGTARTGGSRDCGSPFLYADEAGRPRLDLAQYYRDMNHGEPPDFVTILLGCNDVFTAIDGNIEERIDAILDHMDALIEAIRAAGPGTRIGLMAPVPPAASQDAFGANYQSGQTRWQYKRNQHRLIERMAERYGDREAENLSLVPAYTNLDCAHNYPQHAAPWNARAATSAVRLHNGVHPAPEGYRQIGDSIFCWMKAQLAQP